MRYTTEIIIDLPREKVIPLLDSFENLKKWQPNLKSYDHVGGTPGKVGAKTKLIFEVNGGEMEMFETITVRNFPDELVAVYTTKGALNIFKNYFEIVNSNKTRWKTVSIFRFKGMMAIKSFFNKMPFKNQTLKSMMMFKEFAESVQ
jgi:hypothetical protein